MMIFSRSKKCLNSFHVIPKSTVGKPLKSTGRKTVKFKHLTVWHVAYLFRVEGLWLLSQSQSFGSGWRIMFLFRRQLHTPTPLISTSPVKQIHIYCIFVCISISRLDILSYRCIESHMNMNIIPHHILPLCSMICPGFFFVQKIRVLHLWKH